MLTIMPHDLQLLRFPGSMTDQENSTMASLEMVISGLVQGVGFRFFAQRTAHRHDITGYVLNLPRGKVKVHAEGTKSSLRTLMEELKKGPPLSSVENVEVRWGEYRGRFEDFSVRFSD
jgi:acylphosphatase